MRKILLTFLIIVLAGVLFSYGFTNFKSNKDTEETKAKDYKSEYDDIFNSNLTGDKWPSNDFTRRMPKPTNGELVIKGMGRSRMSFDVKGVTLDDYHNYINIAKEKGFTYQASEAGGYNANNEDGYNIRVSINLSESIMSVSITN